MTEHITSRGTEVQRGTRPGLPVTEASTLVCRTPGGEILISESVRDQIGLPFFPSLQGATFLFPPRQPDFCNQGIWWYTGILAREVVDLQN